MAHQTATKLKQILNVLAIWMVGIGTATGLYLLKWDHIVLICIMYLLCFITIISSLQWYHYVCAGVNDVNMAHLQYLANNLSPGDCRRFVASLYFNSVDLPNAVDQAERKVFKDETCLQQLLHWNGAKSGQKHATHEFLVRRLKQIDREDLAKWLTHAAYTTMNKSLNALGSGETFRMYEPIMLPYVNYTTRKIEPTPPALRVTTLEALVRVVKQDVPDPVEDTVQDPTEWTIFDTISWSIVIILFLLIIVLIVYLILASPCSKKNRCQCSNPSSPRLQPNEYHAPSSQRSTQVSCIRASRPPAHPHAPEQLKPYQQRHFEKEKVRQNRKKTHQKISDYSSCATSECPVMPNYHCECNSTRCKCKRAAFSDSPTYNTAGSYYETGHKPSSVSRKFSHGVGGARTIDIHQKIAIPMTSGDE